MDSFENTIFENLPSMSIEETLDIPVEEEKGGNVTYYCVIA
jgi:hypothetical protein